MVMALGQPRFEDNLLDCLYPVVPAASWSVYRTGQHCRPTLFMSASHGVTDTTRDCWRAYLSGPYLKDRTLVAQPTSSAAALAGATGPMTQLCHIMAREVPVEHRAKVYEAHGVAERVSIVSLPGDGVVFAINFYRHQHQRPFTDGQLAMFGNLAPSLLALTRKHLALVGAPAIEADAEEGPVGPSLRSRLLALSPALTQRELDVCLRLLQGMTQDGIANDLGLSLPTVKTYRNRAFNRLGIHFRNELYALVMGASAVRGA
ncbi:helix-turn-helix transcriptional regulator [Rhodoferax saidenbachensis]|uniref:Helix-turn-helix transcriptional regulator n=2 Tax=Rhodoferax saidenbachensis TaxID=1484693 RepID=A0A1P8KFR0_9BURK|nr:helix-turn-helix transcriptional regulator [Rhodoferax saidenbachensis]APW44826.1 helix-turn-helix transcriptional regulator [Rhodoferax saidenbachensis]